MVRQNYLLRVKAFDLYLIIVSLLGVAIIYISTSTYGPGVSGDSVRYLSAAQNLIQGVGFYDYSLSPILAWPPLYPVVLSLLSQITRDVFVAGWVLNIILFGLTVYLTGRIVETVIPNQLTYAYLSSLAVLVSPSLIRLYSTVAADPLFIVLTLLFLYQSMFYLKVGQFSILLLMGILASLAGLVKYPGLVLSITGSVLALAYHIRLQKWHMGLLIGSGFLFLSALPLSIWVVFHNYLQHGSYFGDRGYAEIWGNIYITVEKMFYWFIPYSIIKLIGLYWLVLFFFSIAFIFIRPLSWRLWFRRMLEDEVLPILLFALFYTLTLIFLVSYAEHKDFREDRLHIIMLFPVLNFIAIAFNTLELRWGQRLLQYLVPGVMVVLFFVWLLFPVYNTYKYIMQSLVYGDVSNNLYNTKPLRESKIVSYLRSNYFAPDDVLYSNHEGAAWFYTRHNVFGMPQGDRAKEEDQNVGEVIEEYRDWPPRPGYVIWFDLNFKRHVLNPKDLTPLATVAPLFQSTDGDLFWVTPK